MLTPLKLATYNIHRCYGKGSKFDPERTAHLIQQLDADIIALQEVETFHEGGANLIDFFSAELGYSIIAGPTMYREDSHYGNAIMTRYEPSDIEMTDISEPGVEPRGMISLLYDFDGTSLHVVATHLGMKSRERKRQLNAILNCVDKRDADIKAVMGDLNEWLPWGGISPGLKRRFGKKGDALTFPARFPLLPLDQILISPATNHGGTFKVNSGLAKEASDHLPLIAELRV